MGRIRKAIDKLLGKSDIVINGSLYMRRWRVVHLRWFGMRLHFIARSDEDREHHDHPFDFVSFVLWRGYTEHTPTRTKRYRPGSIIFRRAEDLHRLELIDGKPAVTFVLRGPYRREWGFVTSEGWVPWYEFRRALQGYGMQVDA